MTFLDLIGSAMACSPCLPSFSIRLYRLPKVISEKSRRPPCKYAVFAPYFGKDFWQMLYLAQSGNFSGGITGDRGDAPGLSVGVDEGATVNAIGTFPADGVVGVGFSEINGLGVPRAGEPGRKLRCGLQHPGIPGFGR